MLISHRLNTVRDADHIFVIEHGDHDTLVAVASSYAKLFEFQAAGYQPAGQRPVST